jgi:predicted DNA-binding transcriptional regulator AlpA
MFEIKSPTEAATVTSQLAAVPRYGSKRDVAAMLQMSVRSVDNFVARGCPHLKVSSRRLRFDMAEVRVWLADTFRTQRRGPAGGKS